MEGTIGEIRMFASTFAPRNWWYCDGTILAIRSNTALFSILGTTYGGDGQTTFGLPDLRGRIAAGVGQGPGLTYMALGEKMGSESVTLNSLNLAAHVHAGISSISIPVFADEGDTSDPTRNVLASATNMYTNAGDTDSNLKPFSITASVSPAGGNQPVPIMQPFMGMNYIVCLTGVFPARG